MDIFKGAKKASLLLQDGTSYTGLHVGAQKEAIGELVFNTSVVGFQEILTDPANSSNIVVETFPLTGNYGVNPENDLSSQTTAKGWVIREWCDAPSNFRCEGRIDQWLEEKGISAVFDIDTRALTRHLRECGSMLGIITLEELDEGKKAELLEKLKQYQRPVPAWKENRQLVTYQKDSAKEPSWNITMIDFGVRSDIIKAFLDRGCKVTVVPSAYTEKQIRETNPDGVVLSGGAICFDSIEGEKETTEMLMKCGFPLLGIDYGHQLMGLCCGGKIEKMKNGHRGANCPVTELATGQTFITTQNHGYVVTDVNTLKAAVSHVNTNDKSCEGLEYLEFPGMSVQFIPESEIGRKNFDRVYERFLSLVQNAKK